MVNPNLILLKCLGGKSKVVRIIILEKRYPAHEAYLKFIAENDVCKVKDGIRKLILGYNFQYFELLLNISQKSSLIIAEYTFLCGYIHKLFINYGWTGNDF